MHPDHPDATAAEGFAGTPNMASLAKAAAGQGSLSKKRVGTWYPIPRKFVSETFDDEGFTDEDLKVFMVELGTKDTEDASRAAGQNAARVAKEMLFISLHKIGNWHPSKDRDRLERWYEAVGPRVKNLLQAAFVKMQSVEEADVASFLESGERARE